MAHENFKTLATKLITKNGATAQLVSITNSGASYNPAQVKTETDVIAVNVKIRNDELSDLVKTDDLMFLIDSSIEPKLPDRFKYESKDYEIKNIKKLKPADTTILYKIQVRL